MNELWPQRQDVGQEEDGAAFRAGKMGLLSERGWLPPVIGVCPAVSSSAQVGALVANKCLVGPCRDEDSEGHGANSASC